MQIYPGVEALKAPFSASVLCLGNFDGLHLGHRELVRRTVNEAKTLGFPSVVFTFSPHPVQILAPEKRFRPMFTRADLAEQLTACGVDATIFQPFDTTFAALSPQQFITGYLQRPLHPAHVWIGPDFAFGQGRAGSIEDLKSQGAQLGFAVDVLNAVMVDGDAVSSSRIRQALQEGLLPLVRKLLGRNFSISGQVVSGAGRGRGLGFPTANFTPTEVMVPKRGVYITRTWVGQVAHPSVTNVGGAPTFQDQPSDPRLETHILDQNLELKGVQIRVEFISYLREERRFDSPADLIHQIHIDVEAARRHWQNLK